LYKVESVHIQINLCINISNHVSDRSGIFAWGMTRLVLHKLHQTSEPFPPYLHSASKQPRKWWSSLYFYRWIESEPVRGKTDQLLWYHLPSIYAHIL